MTRLRLFVSPNTPQVILVVSSKRCCHSSKWVGVLFYIIYLFVFILSICSFSVDYIHAKKLLGFQTDICLFLLKVVTNDFYILRRPSFLPWAKLYQSQYISIYIINISNKCCIWSCENLCIESKAIQDAISTDFSTEYPIECHLLAKLAVIMLAGWNFKVINNYVKGIMTSGPASIIHNQRSLSHWKLYLSSISDFTILNKILCAEFHDFSFPNFVELEKVHICISLYLSLFIYIYIYIYLNIYIYIYIYIYICIYIER